MSSPPELIEGELGPVTLSFFVISCLKLFWEIPLFVSMSVVFVALPKFVIFVEICISVGLHKCYLACVVYRSVTGGILLVRGLLDLSTALDVANSAPVRPGPPVSCVGYFVYFIFCKLLRSWCA